MNRSFQPQKLGRASWQREMLLTMHRSFKNSAFENWHVPGLLSKKTEGKMARQAGTCLEMFLNII